MSGSNTPLSIVRSTDAAKNPKGWPVGTIIFSSSYEKPPEGGATFSTRWTLSDDSYAGKQFTPTPKHPKWGPVVNAPTFPEYVPPPAK